LNNRYIELLKNRPSYRNLWLASLVSLLGDWFNTIASMMIVNRYTETDLAISWILIARTLPRFLLVPFSGALADRFNRRTIMVVSDVLRAGIVLCFLFVDRPERIWLIYVLTVAQFVVASFFEPASNAIIPKLVEGKQELMTANVLSSITWSAMLTLGAAFGGVFAGIFGAEAALVADAVTFLISASFLFRIKYLHPAREVEEHQAGYRAIFEGFKYILEKRHIAALALVKSFGQIGSADIFIVVFSEQFFPLGEEGAISLGILFGAAGLGAILGPLIANRLASGTQNSLRRAIQAGYWAIPLGWGLIAWSPNIWLAGLGVMVRLMGTSLNWTYSNVLIQQVVPDRVLGRVFALDLGLFTLATAIATYLTGYFLDTLPVSLRQLGGYFALGSLLPAVYWSWYQARRRIAESGPEAQASD